MTKTVGKPRPFSPAQLKAARSVLNINVDEFASMLKVSSSTIVNNESLDTNTTAAINYLRRKLEKAGITFPTYNTVVINQHAEGVPTTKRVVEYAAFGQGIEVTLYSKGYAPFAVAKGTRLPTPYQVFLVRQHSGLTFDQMSELLNIEHSALINVEDDEGTVTEVKDLRNAFGDLCIYFTEDTIRADRTFGKFLPGRLTVVDGELVHREEVRSERGRRYEHEDLEDDDEKPTKPMKKAKAAFVATLRHGLNDDLFTHQASWLAAMDRLIELEPVTGKVDEDERGFWQCERNAMARTFEHLNEQAALGHTMVTADQAKDSQRLDVLEAKARQSYTGLSVTKGDGRKDLRVMWHHHLGTSKQSLRAAIDFEFPELEESFTDDTELDVSHLDHELPRAEVVPVAEDHYPPVAVMLNGILSWINNRPLMSKKDVRKALKVDKDQYRQLRKHGSQLSRELVIEYYERLGLSSEVAVLVSAARKKPTGWPSPQRDDGIKGEGYNMGLSDCRAAAELAGLEFIEQPGGRYLVQLPKGK